MKEDIRVLKQIGTISSAESKWQKELNIVSINNGPLEYDLREWSLDHSLWKNGISFNDEEAKLLFAILKECYKDGGRDISIKDFAGIFNSNDQQMSFFPNINDDIRVNEDSLFNILKNNDLSYIDKRELGGALWIIGGHELDSIMLELKKQGYKFFFSEKGGKITQGKAAWYLRANKK